MQLLRIDVKDSGLLVIYCKRSKNNVDFDIYSPYGFGGILAWGSNVAESLKVFEEWMLNNSIISAYLMGHPVLMEAAPQFFTSNRSAFVLDLAQSEDELWLNLGSGHKYELKKLNKDLDISITDDKEELFSVFPRLYANTLTRVGAGDSYHFTADTLQTLTFEKNTMILGARIKDELHAVIMINFTNHCAEYYINATDDSGRHLTRLLLWDAVKRLKKLGVEEFHLGGGATEGDHLEAFKRRMGGTRVLIPVYRKVVNQGKYNELCAAHHKDAEDLSYFPIYWKN